MNRAKKIDLNLIEKAECYRCQHYGGNYLESGFNCSIHPFGPQEESCRDFQESLNEINALAIAYCFEVDKRFGLENLGRSLSFITYLCRDFLLKNPLQKTFIFLIVYLISRGLSLIFHMNINLEFEIFSTLIIARLLYWICWGGCQNLRNKKDNRYLGQEIFKFQAGCFYCRHFKGSDSREQKHALHCELVADYRGRSCIYFSPKAEIRFSTPVQIELDKFSSHCLNFRRYWLNQLILSIYTFDNEYNKRNLTIDFIMSYEPIFLMFERHNYWRIKFYLRKEYEREYARQLTRCARSGKL